MFTVVLAMPLDFTKIFVCKIPEYFVDIMLIKQIQ